MLSVGGVCGRRGRWRHVGCRTWSIGFYERPQYKASRGEGSVGKLKARVILEEVREQSDVTMISGA